MRNEWGGKVTNLIRLITILVVSELFSNFRGNFPFCIIILILIGQVYLYVIDPDYHSPKHGAGYMTYLPMANLLLLRQRINVMLIIYPLVRPLPSAGGGGRSGPPSFSVTKKRGGKIRPTMERPGRDLSDKN